MYLLFVVKNNLVDPSSYIQIPWSMMMKGNLRKPLMVCAIHPFLCLSLLWARALDDPPLTFLWTKAFIVGMSLVLFWYQATPFYHRPLLLLPCLKTFFFERIRA